MQIISVRLSVNSPMWPIFPWIMIHEAHWSTNHWGHRKLVKHSPIFKNTSLQHSPYYKYSVIRALAHYSKECKHDTQHNVMIKYMCIAVQVQVHNEVRHYKMNSWAQFWNWWNYWALEQGVKDTLIKIKDFYELVKMEQKRKCSMEVQVGVKVWWSDEIRDKTGDVRGERVVFSVGKVCGIISQWVRMEDVAKKAVKHLNDWLEEEEILGDLHGERTSSWAWSALGKGVAEQLWEMRREAGCLLAPHQMLTGIWHSPEAQTFSWMQYSCNRSWL